MILGFRKSDPHRLARRLPSRGAGAYHCVLPLPGLVHCPGRVCAAPAEGLGGRGRCRFSLLPLGSCLPLRPSPCVLRVVPPGFPFPSPAGTPFHAVCAFRGLGPVALWVRAAWPLPVCALVLPRRTRPPPVRVGVARALRAVPVQGASRAVPGGLCPSAFPAPVPRSAYLALVEVARSLRPLAWLGVARCPAGFLPLRAGFARCQGRTRAPRGGAPLAWVRSIRGWALSLAQPPVLGACGVRYPLAVGAAGLGLRTPNELHRARSCELGLRAVGATPGRTGRGFSCLGGGRPGLGAHPRSTACFLGRAAGALCPLAVGAGDVVVGTRRLHHTALLRATFACFGGVTMAPGGGGPSPGCGAPRVERSSTPDHASLGRAAGARYPMAVGAGAVGVETRHQPLGAHSCEPALRPVVAAPGRPRGGAGRLAVGRPGLGAQPRPTVRPWGVRLGPATHRLRVRGVWASGPVTNPTARALASWLSVLWVWHGGARGGTPVAWVRGALGWTLTHA